MSAGLGLGFGVLIAGSSKDVVVGSEEEVGVAGRDTCIGVDEVEFGCLFENEFCLVCFRKTCYAVESSGEKATVWESLYRSEDGVLLIRI